MFGDALRARLEVLQTRQAGLQARLQDIARGAALRAVEEAQACTPSHAQAVKMKRYSKEGSLTPALIRSIMEEEKPNQVEQLRIPKKSIARFFRPSATQSEIEGRIVKALELLEQAERRRDGLGGA